MPCSLFLHTHTKDFVLGKTNQPSDMNGFFMVGVNAPYDFYLFVFIFSKHCMVVMAILIISMGSIAVCQYGLYMLTYLYVTITLRDRPTLAPPLCSGKHLLNVKLLGTWCHFI